MPRLTLAQQIAQLEDTAPADFDPEDIYNADVDRRRDAGDDANDDVEMRDLNAGREHYVEVGPSALRTQDGISDPKYDGMKTSRSKLFGQEGDDEGLSEDDAEEEAEEERHVPGGLPSSPSSEDEEVDEVEDHHLEDEEDEGEGESGESHGPKQGKAASAKQTEQEKAKADVLAVSLQKTRVADKHKGRAVTQQLRIWDSLVNARIRLQKTVMTSNKLPHPNDIKSFTENTENSEVIHKFLSEALRLSEDILELRRTLLQKAGSSPPPRKKRCTELEMVLESENVDFDNLVKESTEEMVEFNSQTHLETLTTLQKWSAKVQAVAPAALLSSTKVSFKSGPGHFKSAGELADEALRDPEKLIKRTWSKTVRIGASSDENAEAGNEEKGDEETFDDREFYQAMLRDVIESKGGKDAEVHINPNRQKNKKVDTKASKGRKLRYEPHEKLQNFMVPVPARGAWHEEQIDELFSSLLGKGFEGKANGTTQAEEPVALQGLRIFG